MYSGKLHILTTLAFMIICVTHGGAATYSPLSNKTYTVTFILIQAIRNFGFILTLEEEYLHTPMMDLRAVRPVHLQN